MITYFCGVRFKGKGGLPFGGGYTEGGANALKIRVTTSFGPSLKINSREFAEYQASYAENISLYAVSMTHRPPSYGSGIYAFTSDSVVNATHLCQILRRVTMMRISGNTAIVHSSVIPLVLAGWRGEQICIKTQTHTE